MSFYIQEVVTR